MCKCPDVCARIRPHLRRMSQAMMGYPAYLLLMLYTRHLKPFYETELVSHTVLDLPLSELLQE